MKRTIAFFTVVFLTSNALVAQNLDSIPSKKVDTTLMQQHKDSALANWKNDSVAKKEESLSHKPVVDTLPDRAMMKNGEMIIIKNGDTLKMTDEVAYPSGTVIKTDGTVKKKDGTEVKLKDGQYMTLPSMEDAKSKKDIEKKKKDK